MTATSPSASWTVPARSPPSHPSPAASSPARPGVHKRKSSSTGSRSGRPETAMLVQNVPARTPAARTPAARSIEPGQHSSPNYFGLAVDTSDGFSTADKRVKNWTASPSSHVRSTAGSSPRVVPLDQNPDFAAFRRQSEASSSTFNLGRLIDYDVLKSQSADIPHSATSAASGADSPERSTTSSHFSRLSPPTSPKNSATASGASSDGSSRSFSQSHAKSPKRMLSEDSRNQIQNPHRHSPASFTENDTMITRAGSERTKRNSVHSASLTNRMSRAETLPSSRVEEPGPTMVAPAHVVNLMKRGGEDILLLDLRVATHYCRSRIAGALNLCIPTTLLKRPTFNVQKLTDTFKNAEDRHKFERWSNSRYIVVYDQDSSQMKDATTCINTLKKFEREGWTGSSYIIRGGFDDFAQAFPTYIIREDSRTNASSSGTPGPDPNRPAGMAVIGGCPMPPTKNAANPFFGNIRQNMDLIGGVGQLPVKRPNALSSAVESNMPPWLRLAADEKDDGKRVADRFLQIEKREQKRMQDALSGNVVFGSPKPGSEPSVQLAGIEKGSKNRYNNIWPYEHSRVKLEGVSDDACDYINANFIQSPLSSKRYIATQGPIPATFSDFWSVVWQQDVRVIVMLTAEKEGGQVKAHNYWSEGQYGPWTLKFLSEHRASLEPSKIRHRDRRANSQRRSTIAGPRDPPQDLLPRAASSSHKPSQSRPVNNPPPPPSEQPYVAVRKLMLSNTHDAFSRPREITQMQYSTWPDFGAPAHPAHLLGLVEQCDNVVRSSHSYGSDGINRPVLVHCSAGCGRTGTFCTVDTVVDLLRKQKARREKQSRAAGSSTVPMDLDNPPPAPPSVNGATRNPFDQNIAEQHWPKSEEAVLQRDDVDLVEAVVEGFRLQRLSMVQSLRQFVLCYESILEWICEQQPRTA